MKVFIGSSKGVKKPKFIIKQKKGEIFRVSKQKIMMGASPGSWGWGAGGEAEIEMNKLNESISEKLLETARKCSHVCPTTARTTVALRPGWLALNLRTQPFSLHFFRLLQFASQAFSPLSLSFFFSSSRIWIFLTLLFLLLHSLLCLFLQMKRGSKHHPQVNSYSPLPLS